MCGRGCLDSASFITQAIGWFAGHPEDPRVGLHAANRHLSGCRGPLGTERKVLEDGLSWSGGADHKE